MADEVEIPVYFDDAFDWPIGKAVVKTDGTATLRMDPVEGAQFIEKAQQGVLIGMSLGYAWTEGPTVEAAPGFDVTHEFYD